MPYPGTPSGNEKALRKEKGNGPEGVSCIKESDESVAAEAKDKQERL
jgi:hypothetical protein